MHKWCKSTALIFTYIISSFTFPVRDCLWRKDKNKGHTICWLATNISALFTCLLLPSHSALFKGTSCLRPAVPWYILTLTVRAWPLDSDLYPGTGRGTSERRCAAPPSWPCCWGSWSIYVGLGALVFSTLEEAQERTAYHNLLATKEAFLQNNSCVTEVEINRLVKVTSRQGIWTEIHFESI